MLYSIVTLPLMGSKTKRMENIIFIGLIVLFFLCLSKEEESDNLDLDDRDGFRPVKEEEETFYHPVTGYKGTRSEMDVYIQNRERELKRH